MPVARRVWHETVGESPAAFARRFTIRKASFRVIGGGGGTAAGGEGADLEREIVVAAADRHGVIGTDGVGRLHADAVQVDLAALDGGGGKDARLEQTCGP